MREASHAEGEPATGRAVARSHREFLAKIGTVLEEADESVFWLTLLKRSGLSSGRELDSLLAEADELTAISTTAHKTAKGNFQP